jgi:hypothetical protein
MLAVTLALVLITVPTLSYAQQTMNAQPLTPQSIALTAQEIGPEWSVRTQSTDRVEGFDLYGVIYTSPSGRAVRITTAVATNDQMADGVISYLRYELERQGMTITSVQSNGFGDGRAFKAEDNDGQLVMVSYLFKVRNLTAFVDYVGSSTATDVQAQALALARKQEAKLFAFFAPQPAATPVPTPAPASQPAPTAAPTPAPVVATPANTPEPQTIAYCRPGETPEFRFGFATLSARLGDRMGRPTSCEYSDPKGTGDVLQNTEKGLGFYRKSTNTATFTDGTNHWAVTADGIVYWTGESIDPTADAEPFQA